VRSGGGAPVRLYLVTDRNGTGGRPLIDVVGAALLGGVDAVQLREKDLPARELHAMAIELRALCSRHGALLLINDRIDVALAVDADGVHLPADSFRVEDARALLGPGKCIGVSTHSASEAQAADDAGAGFIVLGPVFDTPSKRDFGEPLGASTIEDACRNVRTPIIAIGGITPERVAAVRHSGAAGVAVISGILGANDPEAAARAYRERLQT
jgi:thiamine-phosphate pyrophosphorylase